MTLKYLGFLLLAGLAPHAASAQSLNCNGSLASAGESAYSVMQKCGEPVLRQNVCVPRVQGYWNNPYGGVPQPYLGTQCVWMEDWTYHRGAGNFLGIVRFYNGAIESVRDGERMR